MRNIDNIRERWVDKPSEDGGLTSVKKKIKSSVATIMVRSPV
jgi:hypothetical protein